MLVLKRDAVLVKVIALGKLKFYLFWLSRFEESFRNNVGELDIVKYEKFCNPFSLFVISLFSTDSFNIFWICADDGIFFFENVINRNQVFISRFLVMRLRLKR